MIIIYQKQQKSATILNAHIGLVVWHIAPRVSHRCPGSFTRRIFHLLLVTKVRLLVTKSSVRRENLGTRLLSGSSIAWFDYLFVWSKMYFFLTHKPWYFMKKSIAFDRVFDRVLEKRETSALKARARKSRANWDWALKEINMATEDAEHVCS